jgi:hypothetical protein
MSQIEQVLGYTLEVEGISLIKRKKKFPLGFERIMKE